MQLAREARLARCLLVAVALACIACSSPTGSAPAPSAGSSASVDKPAWQVEWEKTVADAKAEGEVIVWGDAGDDSRRHQKEAFEAAYPGIRVSHFQAPSSTERDSRLLQELEAGVAKADILIGGSAGGNSRLKPAGALREAKSLLILPEVTDPKNWRDSELAWVDEEQQYILQGDGYHTAALVVNKSIDPSEIQSWWDLLDPKWKGKIVMLDPRQSGAGFARGNFFYHTAELGPTYIQRFFSETAVTFSADQRQNLEWVVSGRYPIYISPQTIDVMDAMNLGLGINIIPKLKVNGTTFKDGFQGSQGIAMVPNIDPLPHPNAAKVYLNWFYSKQGMQALEDIRLYASRRIDLDNSKIPAYTLLEPGVEYVNLNSPVVTSTENVNAMRDLVNKALGQ